jgi:hypothetical protein
MTTKPRRKRQPTADVMREQLRLAADEIIRLREKLDARQHHVTTLMWKATTQLDRQLSAPWWVRLWGRVKAL